LFGSPKTGGQGVDEATVKKMIRELTKKGMIITTAKGPRMVRDVTQFHDANLASEVNRCARESCQGRYLIVTHGGSRADVAEYIFPAILMVLAEGG